MDNKLDSKPSFEHLAAQVRSLQSTLDHVGAYVYTKDMEGRYTYANKMVCNLFCVALAQVIGASDEAFFDLTVCNSLRMHDRRVLDHGEHIEAEEINVIAETGETRIYWSVKTPLHAPDGSIVGLCGISTDITERRRMEAEIAEQRLLLDTILNNIDGYVYMKDRERRFLYVNENTAALFGRKPEEVVGRIDRELLPEQDGDAFGAMDRRVLETGQKATGEEIFHDAQGLPRHYWSIKVPLLKDTQVESYVGISTDITELIRLKEEFQRLANTDELTGISNRRHLLEGAARELKRAARSGESLSVIVFDIDIFKSINDAYGHATGDHVLCAAVDACKKSLREIDLFGRLGGDEFVVVAVNTDLPAAMLVADRLRQEISQAQVKAPDGTCIATTSSFGVATLSGACSFDELLSRADSALYAAKAQGRNRVWHYEQAALSAS
ncbi:MAG: diguanylate cyclase [Burkholderiaceae bacterium]|nr:diguanylate cyclase [Burkholderiaceae bacterium]